MCNRYFYWLPKLKRYAGLQGEGWGFTLRNGDEQTLCLYYVREMRELEWWYFYKFYESGSVCSKYSIVHIAFEYRGEISLFEFDLVA